MSINIDWTKIAVIVVGGLLVTLLVFNTKQCNENSDLRQQMTEMKQLQDGIIRSQTKYASKEDIEKFAGDINLNLEAIQDDLDDFDARVMGISIWLAKSIGKNQTNVPSTLTNPKPPDTPNPYVCPDNKPCEDPYGYLAHSQVLALAELFSNDLSVPIGKVTFESWKEKPWSVFQYPREYHVTTVYGEDQDGKHYTYNKFEIGVNGEKHTVPITKSEFLEEYPEPNFCWWDPHVGFGVYGGVGFNTSPLPDDDVVGAAVVPNVNFSPFSYGRTKPKPDWVFARVGVGYDVAQQAINFSVAPAMWNIGSEVSFIQNTYVGPVIGVDSDGDVSAGVGIVSDF